MTKQTIIKHDSPSFDPKEAVNAARELLNEVMSSRYIPFSSPSPSSTESQIKQSIIRAKNALEIATLLMR